MLILQAITTRVPFNQMPDKTILAIAEEITSQRTLARFARTDRRCYAIVCPYLYEYDFQLLGSSCIFHAIEQGNIQTLEVAFRYGADFNLTKAPPRYKGCEATFETPLHVAVSYGRVEVVAWLLDHGASLDTEGIALHSSLRCMQTIKRASIPRLPGPAGMSFFKPLEMAIFHRDLDIVRLLLARGAAVSWSIGTYASILAGDVPEKPKMPGLFGMTDEVLDEEERQARYMVKSVKWRTCNGEPLTMAMTKILNILTDEVRSKLEETADKPFPIRYPIETQPAPRIRWIRRDASDFTYEYE